MLNPIWLDTVKNSLLYILQLITFVRVCDAFAPRRHRKMFIPSLFLVLIGELVLVRLMALPPLVLFLLVAISLVAFGRYTHDSPWYVMVYGVLFYLMLDVCVRRIVVLTTAGIFHLPAYSLEKSPPLLLLSAIVCLLLTFLLNKDLALRLGAGEENPYSWLLSSFLPLFTLTFVSYVYLLVEEYAAPLTISVFISTGLVGLCLLQTWVLDKLTLWHTVRRDNLLLSQQLELQKRHSSELTGAYGAQRQLSHDFKNHLNILYRLAEQNKDDAVCRYIASVQQQIAPSLVVAHTGSVLVDVLLNQKFAIACQHDTLMELRLCNLQGLALEEADLSVLLCNLLDNALEACQRVKGHRHIWVRIQWQEEELLVSVRNTAPPAPAQSGGAELFPTQKEDSLAHGYGLRNVKAVLERHEGDFAVDWQGEEFTATALFYHLPRPEQSAEPS